jgi:hypothetical protein
MQPVGVQLPPLFICRRVSSVTIPGLMGVSPRWWALQPACRVSGCLHTEMHAYWLLSKLGDLSALKQTSEAVLMSPLSPAAFLSAIFQLPSSWDVVILESHLLSYFLCCLYFHYTSHRVQTVPVQS